MDKTTALDQGGGCRLWWPLSNLWLCMNPWIRESSDRKIRSPSSWLFLENQRKNGLSFVPIVTRRVFTTKVVKVKIENLGKCENDVDKWPFWPHQSIKKQVGNHQEAAGPSSRRGKAIVKKRLPHRQEEGELFWQIDGANSCIDVM